MDYVGRLTFRSSVGSAERERGIDAACGMELPVGYPGRRRVLADGGGHPGGHDLLGR